MQSMHTLMQLNVPPGHVAIHWFEQAAFAIKDSHGMIVLVDPYFPHSRPAEQFIHAQPPLDEAQLPADYILLTHAHSDHTSPETIERIWKANPDVQVVGPQESINQVLSESSVAPDQTKAIHAGEEASLGTMTVHAVYAKPPAGDPAAKIRPPDVTHLGYIIDTGSTRIYISGDPINTFAEHDELTQAVAAHKPDIGFLTTHPSEGEFPFFAGSAKMAETTGVKHAVPVHRACFVKRDYDPQQWADQFPQDGPQPLIMQRNSTIIYPLE